MGYGKVPEPISVLRRCILSSWHLQTVHTSDHCDLVVHGGANNSPAQLALAHAAAPMSSAPINTVSERVRGYKELPSGRGSMPAAHIAQNELSGATHSRLPTSNTNRARPKVLHRTVTANSSCWAAQPVGRNLLWCRKHRVPQ